MASTRVEFFVYNGTTVGVVFTAASGTADVTNGSAAVVGSGTSFTSYAAGTTVTFAEQPNVYYTVLSVTNNTHLTLAENYSGTSVGATTMTVVSNGSTEINGRFGFDEDESTEGCVNTFVAEFVVYGSSLQDLGTKCNALESALRTPYALLTVNFSAAQQLIFQPSVSAGAAPASGFDAAPKLRKLDPWATGLSRAYQFRVLIQVPPNYTDAYGPAVGRRTSTADFHYDEQDKPVITITATYTEIPGSLGRAALLADVYSYCNYRIDLIDNVNSYVLTNLNEPDNNSQTTASFTGTFLQHVFGLRGFTRAMNFSAGGIRQPNFVGTYLAYASSGQWPTNVTAEAAYGDATNGALAVMANDLANLPADEGGPLIVLPGTPADCQLVGQKTSLGNQNTRLDFVLTYRELVFASSNNVGSGLVDPDIFKDNVTFTASQVPVNDSPFPQPLNTSGSSPAPATATGGGGQGFTSTRGAGPPAPPVAATSSQPGSGSNTTQVMKPVTLGIRYEAEFLKTMSVSIMDKWFNVIRPWLVNNFLDQCGYGPDLDLSEDIQPNPTTMSLVASLSAQALPGNLLAFKYSETTVMPTGKRFSGAFTGNLDEYLAQQGLRKMTKQRRVMAVFRAGTFDVTQFATKDQVPGWCVEDTSTPDVETDVNGVADYPQQAITTAHFIEDLVYVAGLVAGSTIGVAPNGAPAAPQNAPQNTGTGGSPLAQAVMAAGTNSGVAPTPTAQPGESYYQNNGTITNVPGTNVQPLLGF